MVMGVISIVTYTSNYSPLLAWGLMIFAVRNIECDFIVSVYFKTFIVFVPCLDYNLEVYMKSRDAKRIDSNEKI